MAAAPPAKNDTTAVEPWTGPREVKAIIEDHPATKFNLLVPTMSIRQANPYLVPDIEYVKLSDNPEDGDIYHDPQMKSGHYAPTARALAKLRQVAGIDVLESRRTDNGKDPDVVEWTVFIEMALPSGQRVRGPGSKRIDLHQLGQGQSPAWLKKAREHLVANAETKALNRAIRSILSLHGSMPQARFRLPFAVLRWVPNMSDPDVRRRMLENLLPATTQAFGPDTRQVGPGTDVVEATPAPDDDDLDDAHDAEFRELSGQTQDGAEAVATGRADAATGEIKDAEPDWLSDTSTTAERPGLVDRLRAVADESAGDDKATPEQLDAIKDRLRAVTADKPALVLLAAFGKSKLNEISQRHAAAILNQGKAIGWDALCAEWSKVATELEAAEQPS